MVEQTKTFEKVILVSVGCSFIAMLHILLLTDWYFDIQCRMSSKIEDFRKGVGLFAE